MDEALRQRLFDALVGKPLVSNAFRGTLVEAIIAQVLEPTWRWCADGWGSFDFEGPNGIGLEVKQSAARQNWHGSESQPCTPRFDIAERTGFWDEQSRWTNRAGRAAAIYVFAWHPLFEPSVADHRDPEQWQFSVISADRLPAQKSIGLAGIAALANPVCYGELAEEVRRVVVTRK